MASQRFGATYIGLLLSFCAAWVVAVASAAHAQGSTKRVGIVRSTGDAVPPSLATEVDEALVRELASLVDIHDPIVAPTSYESVQLALGCESESRECLASIAQTLQTDAVLVRSLHVDSAGLTTLDLSYFETSQQQEARAQATAPAGATTPVTAEMPRLVRRLFGVSDPRATNAGASEPRAEPTAPKPALTPEARSSTSRASADAPVQDEQHEGSAHGGSELRTWAWVTTITGAVVLGTGAVIGLTAQGSWGDLEKTQPQTTSDARKIHDDFDSVETRATLANVLMPVGAAALATGIVLLIVDMTGESRGTEQAAGHATEQGSTHLSLAPARGGGMIVVSGSAEIF